MGTRITSIDAAGHPQKRWQEEGADNRNVISGSASCRDEWVRLLPSEQPRNSVMKLNRYALLLISLLGASAAMAQATVVEVFKSPYCGCCGKWVEHLRQSGFEVKTHDVEDVPAVRQKLGMPDRLGSCHTAKIGGYVVEGHVPASRHPAFAEGEAEGPGPVGSLHAARFAGDGKFEADSLSDAAGPIRRIDTRLCSALNRSFRGERHESHCRHRLRRHRRFFCAGPRRL
jgi:hypothetical protein